ncbi:hypothetical protein ACNKHV_10990 [Shigella flexneri]
MGVDTKQLEGQSDLGFAGFRVFKAPELARRDVVSFLGASYSAPLMIHINTLCLPPCNFTLTPTVKRVPDFTAFWFDTVKPRTLPLPFMRCSIAPALPGAYKFTIHCEKVR